MVQVDIPGMGQMCRHSLALSGSRLWGMGGFDGQNTLAQTFCIDLEGLGQLTATAHTPNPLTFQQPHTSEAPPAFQAPLTADTHTPLLPPSNPGVATPSSSTFQQPGPQPKEALPATMGAESKSEGPRVNNAGVPAEAARPEGAGGGEGVTGGGGLATQEGLPGWWQLLQKATGLLNGSRSKFSSSEAMCSGVAPETEAMDMPSPANFVRRKRESQESRRESHEGGTPPPSSLGESGGLNSAEVRTERENNLANGRALDSQGTVINRASVGEDPTPRASPARAAAISGEELQSIISRVKSGGLLPTPRLALASRLIACSIAQGAPLDSKGDTLAMPNGGFQVLGGSAMQEEGGLPKSEPLPIRMLVASLKPGESGCKRIISERFSWDFLRPVDHGAVGQGRRDLAFAAVATCWTPAFEAVRTLHAVAALFYSHRTVCLW